ncbi:MAG: 50S ribosomal protein L29 [Candidatus Pacebacteria bacterium]|nr:50S ribosomal protein L29 [Candidatus Paceibacterota bacterium]
MKKSDKDILSKNQSAADLKRDLSLKRERLREMRFDLASGKIKNVREIRKIKKEIARILTEINKKSR